MSTRRKFVKMQGLRNHFVIVDARFEPYSPTAAEIVRICDVEVGVGADQLVIIEPPSSAVGDQGAVAMVRFFNVDGPEAEACGNATRCVAWLLLEESGRDAINLETRNGILACSRVGELRVSCNMGPVTMDWKEIPLATDSDTCHLGLESGPLADPVAVGVGNPHAVFFVADLDAVDVCRFAPAIQQNRLFPEQVNVGVAQMVSATRMRLSVYERGAGLTTACGSGACAAVFAALARGLSEARSMTVAMPAGEVDIEIRPDDAAVMTGPVKYCFRGEF
jgi:diaminopimelate epimerase